jgi:shikimate dehydrogenase
MSISGHTRIAGILGWPVAHSRSPLIHNHWLERHAIDGAYIPLPVRPEHFGRAVRTIAQLGFAGGNVTVPHKEAALEAVDSLDAVARRIGAVNTLVVRDDGSLFGTNTDAFGFMENLRHAEPAWDPASGPAVVIGAGGAARAIVVALQDAGAPAIRIVNRTTSRADRLAVDLGGGITVRPWIDRAGALDGAALVVNTTKLGMQGERPLDLPLDRLPTEAIVTDAVYAPLRTPLLERAAARGNRTVDGLGMLLHQARPGFAQWFGVAPEVTPELRRLAEADLGLRSET